MKEEIQPISDRCPCCSAPSTYTLRFPIMLGKEVKDVHTQFRCGSMSLRSDETGTVHTLRTTDCATTRIYQIERAAHVLKTSFWVDDPKEPRVIDSILKIIGEARDAEIAAATAKTEEKVGG